MSLTKQQTSNIQKAVALGLSSLRRPEPLTATEWADQNFYLSSESSYQEGRWKTLPFQVAMLNALGNDDIPTVSIIKSARIGYTKLLTADIAYKIVHKSRNCILWQPTDKAAKSFMSEHINPMIRDVAALKVLAPWVGKKHQHNTLDTKRFANGKMLWVLGGQSPRNYREKSADNGYYDEISSFDEDIGREGSATSLGDERMSGSVFGQSTRGSTPKIAGICQIEKSAAEADEFFRREVPCPHCDDFQVLKFGGSDAEFGMKWEGRDHKTAHYVCEYCHESFYHRDISEIDAKGRWVSESGMTTVDGIRFYDDHGKPADAPEHIAFHIWKAYSPFAPWPKLVGTFLKAKDDPAKLKTFVNTSLGETWQEDAGEKIDPNSLYLRREHYGNECPPGVLYVTAGVDVQDDRFEYEVIGWGKGEQSWSLEYGKLVGNPGGTVIWNRLAEALACMYGNHAIETFCIDSGGHFTQEVYQFAKKVGTNWCFPIRGSGTIGKPIITFPTKRNKHGVWLVEVGVNNAQDLIQQRHMVQEPGPGYCHWPINTAYDEEYFKQLTVEVKRERYSSGRRVVRWECPSGKRNEVTDCRRYALAALRIAQQRKGLKLDMIKPTPKPKKETKNQWVKTGDSWL